MFKGPSEFFIKKSKNVFDIGNTFNEAFSKALGGSSGASIYKYKDHYVKFIKGQTDAVKTAQNLYVNQSNKGIQKHTAEIKGVFEIPESKWDYVILEKSVVPFKETEIKNLTKKLKSLDYEKFDVYSNSGLAALEMLFVAWESGDQLEILEQLNSKDKRIASDLFSCFDALNEINIEEPDLNSKNMCFIPDTNSYGLFDIEGDLTVPLSGGIKDVLDSSDLESILKELESFL